ncbi:MAG: YqaE/Pmp3 family membrane protein [Saprospiraceae bacterium]|nr:YqaE/Pmp3 family membrane protein [Lewinella sp.]
MFLVLLIGTPTAQAVVRVSPVKAENTDVSSAENREMSRKEIRETKKETRQTHRQKRKEIKQELRQTIREWKKGNASNSDLVLLVILAILLPPLAMALYDGITNRFWISLLLTILGWLPGVIYTLIIILGEK